MWGAFECIAACIYLTRQAYHARMGATGASNIGLQACNVRTDTAMPAGEPELAVAVHCLQRPIIVYKQVQAEFIALCAHACMRLPLHDCSCIIPHHICMHTAGV